MSAAECLFLETFISKKKNYYNYIRVIQLSNPKNIAKMRDLNRQNI